MDINFNNKTIVVTGAGQGINTIRLSIGSENLLTLKCLLASGIGNDLCKRLYQHGAKVYAFSRSKGPLDELKKECPNIEVVTVDLGNWNDTNEALNVLNSVQIDGLVNNAAIAIIKPFEELAEKDFDELSSHTLICCMD